MRVCAHTHDQELQDEKWNEQEQLLELCALCYQKITKELSMRGGSSHLLDLSLCYLRWGDILVRRACKQRDDHIFELAGTCVVYKQLCSLSLSLCLSVTISMLIYREWLMMMNRRKIPLGTRERAIGALELGHSITPDPVGVVDPSLPSTSSPSRCKPRRLPTDAPPPSSPAPCSPAPPSRHARHHRQPRTSDALLRNVVLSPRAH